MRSLVNFATANPITYFGLCCAVGLVIRWYWVGQDFMKFMNPFAPLFV